MLRASVVVTTTKYTGNDEITSARRAKSLALFAQLSSLNIPTIVYDNSDPSYRLKVSGHSNCVVIDDSSTTMGSSRRAVLSEAVKRFNPNYVMWIEPEKSDLAEQIPLLFEECRRIQSDILIVGRDNLCSYPTYQQETEALTSELFSRLLGIDCDPMFGPRILSRRGVEAFLKYPELMERLKGHFECKDLWDAIFFPILSGAISEGLNVSAKSVHYKYGQDQREAEQFNPQMHDKRHFQALTIATGSLITAQVLGKITEIQKQQMLNEFKAQLDLITRPTKDIAEAV